MPEGAAGRIASNAQRLCLSVTLVLRVEQSVFFPARARASLTPRAARVPNLIVDLRNSCLGARMARSSGSESTSGSDSDDLREREF